MRKINTIIIHHSASPDVPASKIRDWHVNGNGWRDIGYHFVIRKNGNIELGRSINEVGAHAKGRNNNSIGICLTGSLNEDAPTLDQKFSLVNLVNGLINDERFNIENVEQHHEQCPGKNFPWKWFNHLIDL